MNAFEMRNADSVEMMKNAEGPEMWREGEWFVPGGYLGTRRDEVVDKVRSDFLILRTSKMGVLNFVCKFASEHHPEKNSKRVKNTQMRERTGCQCSFVIRELDNTYLTEAAGQPARKGLLKRSFGVIPTELVKGWYITKANVWHSGHSRSIAPKKLNSKLVQRAENRNNPQAELHQREYHQTEQEASEIGEKFRRLYTLMTDSDRKELLAHAAKLEAQVFKVGRAAAEGPGSTKQNEKERGLGRRKKPEYGIGANNKKIKTLEDGLRPTAPSSSAVK
uniref:Uncharacterized protein n=1 Tax=Rhodosorus marinus TaxID=101924 RepID=A0A7S0BM74_9RHOD|mmetsp:Transcript_21643/g.31417  ORF Transcript_21643/g.31417 Transcript_21643/m.31417 type:complete len:277 (+) Transcript_21643:55-885(+)